MRILSEPEVNNLLATINSLFNAQLKILAKKRDKKKKEEIKPVKEVTSGKTLDIV